MDYTYIVLFNPLNECPFELCHESEYKNKPEAVKLLKELGQVNRLIGIEFQTTDKRWKSGHAVKFPFMKFQMDMLKTTMLDDIDYLNDLWKVNLENKTKLPYGQAMDLYSKFVMTFAQLSFQVKIYSYMCTDFFFGGIKVFSAFVLLLFY